MINPGTRFEKSAALEVRRMRRRDKAERSIRSARNRLMIALQALKSKGQIDLEQALYELDQARDEVNRARQVVICSLDTYK